MLKIEILNWKAKSSKKIGNNKTKETKQNNKNWLISPMLEGAEH